MEGSDINIKFENQQQVSDYAAKNNKVLVVFNDRVLDATSFAQHHPGGAGLIRNCQTQQI